MRDEVREMREDPGHRFFEFQLHTKNNKRNLGILRRKAI